MGLRLITEIYSLADFTPSSTSDYAYRRLVDEGMSKKFIVALSEHYPNGISENDLDELLYNDPAWCYELVGLNTQGYPCVEVEDVITDGDLEGELEELIEHLLEEKGLSSKVNRKDIALDIWDYEFEIKEYLKDPTDGYAEDLAEHWWRTEGKMLATREIEDQIDMLVIENGWEVTKTAVK